MNNIKTLFKTVIFIIFFSVLTRLLGFFFRIYLSRVLGAEALGIYQVALSVFMVLITFVSSGLPFVISKLCAKYHHEKNKKVENSVVTSALIIGLIASVILCLTILIFKQFFGSFFTDERCIIILIVLLPAVIFTSIYSTFRGALWGHSNFWGVCLAELFEQIARIVLCVIFLNSALSVFESALTAAWTLTLACIVSMVFVIVLYFIYGNRLSRPKKYHKELLKSSLPITGVRVFSNLIPLLIAIILPMRLMAIGYSNAEAMSTLGVAVGMTLPFLLIPATLTGSLSMALVPNLAIASAENNKNELTQTINSSFTFTLLVSFILVPIFWSIGEDVGIFFYDNVQSGLLLSYACWIMVPLGIIHLSNCILNSLNLETKSFKNYIIGILPMFLCIWFLPKYIGINAVIWAMGLNSTVTAILNLIYIKRKLKIEIKILKPLLLFSVACLPVAAFTFFINGILKNFISMFFSLAISSTLGAVCYLLICSILNLFDLKHLIQTILKKIGLKKLKFKKNHA